jgi:UDP-N-acetylglucosamine 2-epimerase
MKKIVTIISARPQFVKCAPVSHALRTVAREILIHTGQHYDYTMSKVFFDELGIPEPDYNLGVGSGTHGYQTGQAIQKVEEVLIQEKPDVVVVYGDTNSTLAGALAAAKLHIPVAHVEAGLRSYNTRMPEEINRVLTDHVSSLLLCPTERAIENLREEGFVHVVNDGKLADGVYGEGISSDNPLAVNVGDVMFDALLANLPIAERKSDILAAFSLKSSEYVLTTVHRAENTDDRGRLSEIVQALREVSKTMNVIFPVHPRTRKMINSNFPHVEDGGGALVFTDPVGYFDMLILEKNAAVVVTDSGGVQKEAFLLRVPCITLRNETEWVETVESGWNRLSGSEKEVILSSFAQALEMKSGDGSQPYGDGSAAARIARAVTGQDVAASHTVSARGRQRLKAVDNF